MADDFSFNDIMDGFFDKSKSPSTTPRKKKVEKGVAWEAKLIDGVYYIPLSQVADLLETNNVLPAVQKGIKARVRAQKDRKDLDI